MAMAEISRTASASASPGARSAAGAFSMLGSTLNLSMNRRSIQSFQRQIRRPLRNSRPRDATAYLSPVLIRLSQCFWGL